MNELKSGVTFDLVTYNKYDKGCVRRSGVLNELY